MFASAKRGFVIAMTILMGLTMLTACGNAQETPNTTNETEPTMNIMQKSDPTQDDELNVLMIGNSFCYYYVEELYGMLTAAGYQKVNICNVYYSGCSLDQHWSWWKNGESHYTYYTTNETGRNEQKDVNLEHCLQQRNWDIISLQEAGARARYSGEGHLTVTEPYLTDLWGYIKEQFPLSRYFWHQTWSNQVGYDRNGKTVDSLEQQEKENTNTRAFALAVCKKYDLEHIPSGDAWQIVRQNGYDNLCARLAVSNGEGDYYHDGDIGGAQYLNACVWFEIITGKSCIGNAYTPAYNDAVILSDALQSTLKIDVNGTNFALKQELIDTLQKAAHEAVAQLGLQIEE